MKGAVIREFVRWYEENQGKDRMREIAARAPADLRDLLDPDKPLVTLLAATWYPARFVHALLDTLAESHSEAELRRMAHDSTRALVAQGTHSAYRFLLAKLVTPDMYAASIPFMWKQLHSTGERRVRIVGEGRAESVVSRWPGHHPLLCTVTIETMCSIFELMGCADVRWDRRSCVSDGGAECATDLTWR